MQPKLELLSLELVSRILDEAFLLMQKPGIKVLDQEARGLLAGAGASVDGEIVHIPERLVRKALETTPTEFWLHDRSGDPTVHYGGDDVHFDPGSSGVHILDSETGEHRSSQTKDLIELVKVAEMLSAYDAQSTAVVCHDVSTAIGDLYRLYIVLWYSAKPIVTGAFTTPTLHNMLEMLSVYCKDQTNPGEKPQAIFDVCPSPPLIWSEFGAQNLIILARNNYPAELISMPLAGAAAPVTLLGSVVQHAAENLSGITIHQLANPGAPIVWGGAPAIFDMRFGSTPMGAIETAMIDIAYAQVGKSLNLPTHCYLGASDSKILDAQAGMESGISAVLGALAGINMISGAGMLDFLACQSAEKLVLDSEAINMAKRLMAGISVRTDSLASQFYGSFDFKGNFLRQKLTRELFLQEQYLPSEVIDRGSVRSWQESGCEDAQSRARKVKDRLLEKYVNPVMDQAKKGALNDILQKLALDKNLGEIPLLGPE